MTNESYDPLQKLTEAAIQNEQSLVAFAWNKLRMGRRVAPDDVRDAISEAYLIAATKLRNQPNLVIDNYAAWLQRILLFVCLANARRTRKSASRTVDWNSIREEFDTLEVVYSELNQPGNRLDAHMMISSLGHPERQILQMSLEGYTSEEIADLLEIIPDTVRQKKSRALKEIRKRFVR